MKSHNHELIEKLDLFIRKYYKNRLTRGFLWSLALTALLFLVVVLLEYFFYFGKNVRTVIFFVYTALLLFVVIRLIMVPALQLLKMGKLISHEQAAEIIGDHFNEIRDKLLNTLQLIRMSREHAGSDELLIAGIEQKTRSLKVFSFSRAIDFRKNMKYLRIAAVPVGILLLLSLISPGTISEPAGRIVHFNETYIKPLPYNIEILNKSWKVVQQEDFEVKVKMTGEEIPGEIFIIQGDTRIKLNKERGFVYSYMFKSVQSDISFHITAGDMTSEELRVSVVPRPIILNFELALNYPEYTGKKNEKIENQGDVIIPEGTAITWNIYTKDVSDVKISFSENILTRNEKSGNRFSFSGVPLKNCNYSLTPQNEQLKNRDSLRYRIVVQSDGFPSVFVTETTDSALAANLFFRGTIKDDYGFTSLKFNYSVFNRGDTSALEFHSEILPIDLKINNQVFYYSVDLVSLLDNPGKTIRYYFEVTDNDQFNGPKSARSEERTITTPTLEEIAERTNEIAENINDELEKNLKEARAIQKNINELNKKLVDQNTLTWEDRKKLEDMVKAQENVEKRIEDLKKQHAENISNEEKYLETGERIMEKQRMLNEMMDQMLPDELKKMIDELKAMMNQVDKQKLGEMLEKMKMTNKDLENQLDRNLALMKQIEFDRKLEDLVRNLNKTAEELERLSDQTENNSKKSEELVNELEKLKDKFDSLQKKAESLAEDGKKLEEPVELGDTKKAGDSISQNLEEGKQELNKGNNKKSSGKQKKAASEMKQMAQQMQEAGEGSEEEQLEEDAGNIRKILADLVRLSFEQEEMITETRSVNRNDPRYMELMVKQKEFGDKLKIIEDSLNAIAKRQIMIKPVVSREIASINNNNELALESFEARSVGNVVIRQQYIMTSINNLALLLDESLQKMNQQMSNSSMQSKGGNKSCNNPNGKGGKKSAKDLKDLQGKIGEQLKKMKEGLESQKNGNSRKEMQGMNRELARLAAQQEALRNAMQKYQEELSSQGIKDQRGLNEAARDMEQIEKDLINKRITQETINRQQKILTRLLESEKAEQTREKEERRESTEAKNQKISNLGKTFEYNRLKRGSEDQLIYTLPVMNPFYKSKVNSYIVKIGD